MWHWFGRLGRRDVPQGPVADDKGGALDSALQALDEGEAVRPLPTLICRQCGLQYSNTGTYLQGARCPACHPHD